MISTGRVTGLIPFLCSVPRYAQMIMGMHLEDDATTQQPSRKRAKPEKPEVEPDYERAPRRPPDEGGPQEDPGTLPTKTLKGDVVTGESGYSHYGRFAHSLAYKWKGDEAIFTAL